MTYEGSVPDPFREGREIVIDVRKEGAGFVGQPDSLVTKCPSKFTAEPKSYLSWAMLEAGRACLILALAICVYGIGASLYGARTGRRQWVASGRRAAYALAGVLVLAFAILEFGFIRSDFSFALVAEPLVLDDAALLPGDRGRGPRRRARCCCGC